MADTMSGYCPMCNERVRAIDENADDSAMSPLLLTAHVAMTIATSGIWLAIVIPWWILKALFRGLAGRNYECADCGHRVAELTTREVKTFAPDGARAVWCDLCEKPSLHREEGRSLGDLLVTFCLHVAFTIATVGLWLVVCAIGDLIPTKKHPPCPECEGRTMFIKAGDLPKDAQELLDLRLRGREALAT